MGRSLKFGEWERVRVVKPCAPGRLWDGRLPQVGECGDIVHIHEDENVSEPGAIYVVENMEFEDSCNADLIWLAEFSAEEIERC